MIGTDVRRARRWFWSLTALAVLAAGTLGRALAAPAGPATAFVFLMSGTALVASIALAARILLALQGPIRRR
jgi:2-keto-3-deoxy-galactonokinase